MTVLLYALSYGSGTFDSVSNDNNTDILIGPGMEQSVICSA